MARQAIHCAFVCFGVRDFLDVLVTIDAGHLGVRFLNQRAIVRFVHLWSGNLERTYLFFIHMTIEADFIVAQIFFSCICGLKG